MGFISLRDGSLARQMVKTVAIYFSHRVSTNTLLESSQGYAVAVGVSWIGATLIAMLRLSHLEARLGEPVIEESSIDYG